MVGWIPWDMSLRIKKAAEFVDRVKKSQSFGIGNTPVLLQYDRRVGDMRPWIWPEQDGVPISPDRLDRYRYTHYFKGPSCVCAFIKDNGTFTEAKIGLVQLVRQPPNADCIGRYVAMCATQECDYFVSLDRYFGHPNLMVGEYCKRDEPIQIMDPFIFTTDDTEETMKRTGLRQIQVLRDDANNGLRGTNKMLRREDPERFLDLQDSLTALLLKGLSAEKFWDLFVQCTSCKYVMPHQYFPYYHHCMVQVVHPQLGLPRGLAPPRLPKEPPSNLQFFDPNKPLDDDDDSLVPADPTSDDPIYEMPLLDACALLARREALRAGDEPVTPRR